MSRAAPGSGAGAGGSAAGPLGVPDRRGRPGLAPIVAGFLLILLVAGISIWLVRETRAHNLRVVQTMSVLSSASELDQAITESNSTQRGLMLTGAPVFRHRFEVARGAVMPALAELREGVAANPAQRARVDRLGTEVEARMAEIGRVDGLIRAGNLREAIARTLTALGQTDRIRTTLADIRAAETAELRRRQADAERAGGWLLATSLIGLALIVLFAAQAIRGMRAGSRQLSAAYAEVEALNRDLEARVAARTADLAEANEEIQRFAYVVSHDLRAPLVNIVGFTAELEEAAGAARRLVAAIDAGTKTSVSDEDRRLLTEEFAESIGFVRASTARMDSLIRAILALSREGRRVLNPEPVALTPLVGDIVDSLRQQADAAGATIRVGALPEIETDRLAIEQILANLIDNAIKYLRPGVPGLVEVTAETAGPFVRVTVADNGRGIAAADRERVFDLFRRAGAQDRPGEGIGLAHVRALARRMGGSIQLESEPGAGSRFTLNLPSRLARPPQDRGVPA